MARQYQLIIFQIEQIAQIIFLQKIQLNHPFGGGPSQDFSNSNNSASFQNFEEFWGVIKKDYEGMNRQVDVNLINLSWKDDLKNVLESNQGNNVWRVIQSVWKNCKGSGKEMEVFCGYLSFRNEDKEYKVKGAWDPNNSKWRVKVVKKENEGVSYYKNSTSQWTLKQVVNFGKLDSFEKNIDEWSQFEEDSIIT